MGVIESAGRDELQLRAEHLKHPELCRGEEIQGQTPFPSPRAPRRGWGCVGFLAQPHSSVNPGHGGTCAAGSSAVVLRREGAQRLEEFRLFSLQKKRFDNIFRQIKEGLPKEGGIKGGRNAQFPPVSAMERQKERGKRPE